MKPAAAKPSEVSPGKPGLLDLPRRLVHSHATTLRHPLPFVAIACASSLMLLLVSALGSDPNQPPALPGTAETPATIRRAVKMPPFPPPPLPTRPPTPVDRLRTLLASTEPDRQKLLQERPERQRAYLQERLRELDVLAPAAREVQLRLLELRYYLSPLLRAAPADRPQLLQFVPARVRPALTTRLEAWDRLTTSDRERLLQTENALRFAMVIPRDTTQAARPTLPPDRQAEVERDLTKWRELSADRRHAMATEFERFLAMDPSQREKTLGTLSKSKRDQTEEALRAIALLPPAQRAKCLQSLDRLTQLSPEQQKKFFLNAARWQSMDETSRRAWRELTSNLPPSPPGLELGAPSLPPLPGSPLPNKTLRNAKAGP